MTIIKLSLILVIIGALVLYFAGVKSGAKVRYKTTFIVLGVVIVCIGVYGIITSFL